FIMRRRPTSTLFPYTTLFRSELSLGEVAEHRRAKQMQARRDAVERESAGIVGEQPSTLFSLQLHESAGQRALLVVQHGHRHGAERGGRLEETVGGPELEVHLLVAVAGLARTAD